MTVARVFEVDRQRGTCVVVLCAAAVLGSPVWLAAQNVLVHGGKGSGVDALHGLSVGTTVAVHYTVTGTGHDLDRAPTGATRVTVYYTDEGGRRVAHFFKKTS